MNAVEELHNLQEDIQEDKAIRDYCKKNNDNDDNDDDDEDKYEYQEHLCHLGKIYKNYYKFSIACLIVCGVFFVLYQVLMQMFIYRHYKIKKVCSNSSLNSNNFNKK